MNGFLARLAAKELGTAPALAPRLASRFETEPAHSPMSLESIATRDDETPSPQAPHGAAPDEDTIPQRAARDAAATFAESGEAVKNDAAVAEREASPARTPQRSSPSDAQSPATQTIVRETILERTRPAARDSSPTANTMPSPLRVVPAELRIVEPQVTQAEPAERAESDVLPAPTSDDAKPPQTSPSHVSSRAMSSRADDAGSAKTTETIVNVSIGRIEVRATPSAKSSPPSRREAAAQPMRLEEYLRGRGGRSVS